MQVTVSFVGVLANFVGAERMTVDLPQGSRCEELLAEVGRRFAANMPEQLWDPGTRSFTSPILATRDERTLARLGDSELVEGDDIKLFLMGAGG
jgi:hypothetical protein